MSDGAVSKVVEGANTVSKWSAQQVLVIGCVGFMVFTTGLVIWFLVEVRGDRHDERASNQRVIDTLTTTTGERHVSDQKFFAMMDENRSRDYKLMEIRRNEEQDARVKAILHHCTEEGTRSREVIKETNKLLIQVLTEVSKLVGKKMGDEVPDEPHAHNGRHHNDHRPVILVPDIMPPCAAPPPRPVFRTSN